MHTVTLSELIFLITVSRPSKAAILTSVSESLIKLAKVGNGQPGKEALMDDK